MQKTELNKFDAKQWYLSNFEVFESRLNGHQETPFHDTRKQAIARFADLGFPTPRNEEWKYTNVAPILRHKFELPVQPVPVDAGEIRPLIFDGFERSVLVFVNGQFEEKLSAVPAVEGVVVTSLQQALTEHFDLVAPHLGRYAAFEAETFTALNTAFVHDGLFVYVPDGVELEQPLQIVYLSKPQDGPTVSYPRNLVVVGKGSRLQFVETYGGGADGPYFTNAVTEVLVERDAVVDHVKIQKETEQAFHVGGTYVQQERQSTYTSVNLDLGGTLVRNNLNIRLNDEHCETHMYGFYLGHSTQHIDNHTFIDHAEPHCFSNELYKGILGGQAQGVFNGKILVRPKAQKTNALQSNKTLLLTNDAAINAKPQLEIFADDVRCTHGATIGQLDEEALFYLRARGISERSAEGMLRYAFVSDVFEGIKIESLRSTLEEEILERLKSIEAEG